jgi:hypothetical protein
VRVLVNVRAPVVVRAPIIRHRTRPHASRWYSVQVEVHRIIAALLVKSEAAECRTTPAGRQAGRTTWLPPPRVLRRCLFRPTDRMKMNPPHDTTGECVRVASEQLRPNGGWERTVAGARAGIFASTLVHCLVGYPASSPPKTSPFVERRQCQTNTRLAGPTKHSREMPGTVPNPGGAGHAVVGGVQFRWLQLRVTRTCIPRIENNGKRSHACIARLSYLCYVDDDGETASATTMMSSFCFFFYPLPPRLQYNQLPSCSLCFLPRVT